MAKRNAHPDDSLPTINKERGDLEFFSVSSQKTFRLCPRNWWFDKHEGKPQKQTKGAQLGDECHQRVEHYMLTGEDVRGPVEREGAHLLAPYFEQRQRNPASIEVEPALYPRLRTPRHVTLRGFTDLLVHPGASPWGDGLPEFVDHKFMRTFEYVPDEEELRQDPQGLGYAAWGLLVRWPGLTHVRFTHHQHAREGRDRTPRRVSVVHSLTDVRAAWEKTTREIDVHMRGVARLTDESRVPVGDIDGDENGKGRCCDAYGRCSYRSICSASPENKFASLFTPAAPPIPRSSDMGLLSDVMNQSGGSASTTPPAAPAKPPEPPPAPAAAPGKLLAKAATANARYNLPGGKVGSFVTLAGTFAVFSCDDGTPLTIAGETEVSPAAATAAAAPAAAAPKPETFGPCELCETTLDAGNTSTLRSGARVHVGCPGPKPAPAAAPVQTSNVGGAVLAPDAPASNPAAAPAPVVEQPAPAAESAPEAEGEKKPRSRGKKTEAPASNPTAVSAASEFMVIVNAGISHPIAQPLGPVIAATHAELCEKGKILDVRAAPKDHPLAYGAWKGALSAGVLSKLQPGIYTVESGDLADPVIEALSGKAVIIRGR